MNNGAITVQMLYERFNAAFKIKRVLLSCRGRVLPPWARLAFGGTFILKRNANSARKICLLTQLIKYTFPIKFYFTEYLRVRLKSDSCAIRAALSNFLYNRFWLSTFIFLRIQTTILTYLRAHIDRKRVYHRRSYSMQSTGDFIRTTAKFPSGVKCGHNSL